MEYTCSNENVARTFLTCQSWECLLDTDEALCLGTAFPSLYMPFRGRTLTNGGETA